MRLLTPLGAILLTIAVCPRALYPQDSPIYLNDNGNIPDQLQGQKGKAPNRAKKRPMVTPAPWSYYETHINHGGGIKHDLGTGEYYIELRNHRAVCLELPDGKKIDLTTHAKWTLTSVSKKDKAVITSDGINNKHIHIDPGKYMGYNPPWDMDDPDPDDVPNGKNNQMTAGDFNGTKYGMLPGQSFIIHYCGPKGCLGGAGGNTDQCK